MSFDPKPLFIDIETTGLDCDCKVVSCAIKECDGGIHIVSNRDCNDKKTLSRLYEKVAELKADHRSICTYNGENFRGGFDLRFLRTQFAINRIPWPFRGMRHLDCYPLIEKKFNMQYQPNQTEIIDKIPAAVAKTIVKDHNIPAKDKDGKELKLVKDIRNSIKKYCGSNNIELFPYLTDIEIKSEPGNKLDHVYEVFGGPDLSYLAPKNMCGAKVPEMFKLYEQTQDPTIMEIIEKYNSTDVIQLEYAYKIIIEYVSDNDMQRSWFMI